MSLCCCQTKVQWVQVVFDGGLAGPELSRPTNPPSPVFRRAQNASMENPVMILPGVSVAEMTKQESLANEKVSARQPCWSKTDFDMKLALKFILGQSIRPCNIAGHISVTFPKK